MTTALVLAGGGARGAYQAKVAQRIFESDIEISAITGISVGALNGSILSENNPKKLTRIWQDTRKPDVWAGGHGPIRYFEIAIGSALGLYDPTPLRETISKNYNPNSTVIPFSTGAVNLKTGEYKRITINPQTLYSEERVKYIRDFVTASTAIPVAVEPFEVDGTPMGDGGIRNMAPIEDALQFDPDRIIVILNTQEEEEQEQPLDHLADVSEKVIESLIDEIVKNDIQTAKVINSFLEGGDLEGYERIPIDVIRPSESLGSRTDFSEVNKRFEIGEKDADEFLTDS